MVDFCKADDCNVYRTENYIVVQKLYIQDGPLGDAVLYSRDTYIERNVIRDMMYKAKYGKRVNLDGKRIRTSTYIRKYIE